MRRPDCPKTSSGSRQPLVVCGWMQCVCCTARLGKCDSIQWIHGIQRRRNAYASTGAAPAGTSLQVPGLGNDLPQLAAGDPSSMAIIKTSLPSPPNLRGRSRLLAWHFATCRAHARPRSHGRWFLQFRKAHGDRHETRYKFSLFFLRCVTVVEDAWRWFKNRLIMRTISQCD